MWGTKPEPPFMELLSGCKTQVKTEQGADNLRLVVGVGVKRENQESPLKE